MQARVESLERFRMFVMIQRLHLLLRRHVLGFQSLTGAMVGLLLLVGL
jgi:hypothetical protein